MNILFICTSNKDRSPALERYFRANYPAHCYRSAGINRFFTHRHGTHLLTENDIVWADLLVYAESVHMRIVVNKWCMPCDDTVISAPKAHQVLNIGEFNPTELHGPESDYLLMAAFIVNYNLNHMTNPLAGLVL